MRMTLKTRRALMATLLSVSWLTTASVNTAQLPVGAAQSLSGSRDDGKRGEG